MLKSDFKMTDVGIIGILLAIANLLFSYKGFTNQTFFDGYKFEVDKILIAKDYKRLITSGFLHINWTHLLFNMLSLLAFSAALEFQLGEAKFLVIYFASLLGGDLLSLFVHRHHGDYSAVGASGAVCGVIFASIALFPGMRIGFFGLPVSIPGWIYGILYVAYSLYGIKSNKNNVGYDAHLGGALVGMFVALAMEPRAFSENYFTVLIIALPAVIFIYLLVTKPAVLLIDDFHFKTRKNYHSIDHRYNAEKVSRQQELDQLLDKINKKGLSGLSKKEKETLRNHSGRKT